MLSKTRLLSLVLIFNACNAWAAANVQTLSGDVRVEPAGRAASTATVNQRLEAGTTVHTGANGQTMLRFDDGQVVALSANSAFRIDQFTYDASKPAQDNVAMSFLRGTLRLVTGLIGKRDPGKFTLSTPTATIGIRGTDFMLASLATNKPTYIQVLNGSITTTNTAGTTLFSAGTFGFSPSATMLSSTFGASALPIPVTAAFGQLGALPIVGVAPAGSSGALGAGSATTSAVGGIGATGMTIGAIAAVAAVMATASSTGTTGTTAAESGGANEGGSRD